MSTQTKRSSQMPPSIPPPAKPPCKIGASAIISEKALLVGTHLITIGANTVIHPFAKLDATNAPLELGQNCIVAERAVIGILGEQSSEHSKVVIDDFVSIETGATVEASVVGKASIVGAFSTVRAGCNIGKFCKVTAATKIAKNETIEDWTIVLPDGQQRNDTTTSTRTDIQELKLKGHKMHIETLRRLIPSNIAKWTT